VLHVGPQRVSHLPEGLSGVILSDRHTSERTSQHVLARDVASPLARRLVLVHAVTYQHDAGLRS
jgi:hypothetical protein